MSDSLLNNANERETALARKHATSQSPTHQQAAPLHPVLRLQRQVGNAQVSRMLADRAVMREAEEEELQMNMISRWPSERARVARTKRKSFR